MTIRTAHVDLNDPAMHGMFSIDHIADALLPMPPRMRRAALCCWLTLDGEELDRAVSASFGRVRELEELGRWGQ